MPVQKHVPQVPKPYPLRLQLECGESLFGFLHRFAERNGLPRTTWLTGDLRIPFGSSYLSPDQIVVFSIMCGIPAPDLANRQTSGAPGARAQILGTPLQRQHVKATLSRMCLQCIEERPCHCLVWNLLPVTHCPLHNALLIDTCPTCHAPLEWQRPRLFKCKNDHDLRRSHRVSQDIRTDVAGSEGIRAIYEHCGFDHGGTTVLAETPSAMRNLPAGEFMELLIWLGELGTRATAGPRPRESDSAGSLSIGLALTRSWPTKLHELLEPHITNGPRFLRTELSRWLTKTLTRLSPAKKEIVKPALADLAQSHGRARIFGVDHPTEADLVSIAQARTMLGSGIPLSKLHQLADENGWYVDGASSGWLVRSKIEQSIRERRDRVSLNSLRATLGTKPENIRRMIALGVFGAAAADRLPTTRGNPFLYRPELSDFLKTVDASIDREKRLKDAVTWIQYTRRVETGAVDLPTTIKAVMDGRIRPVGRRSQQIGGLTFRLEDLLALPQESCATDSRSGDVERPMRIAEVAFALGIDRKVLDTAVRLKLIRCTTKRTGKRLIMIADAKDFLAEYTCARLIAQRCGGSAFSIALLLDKSSVQRAGGKMAKGVAVFRISDLREADFDAVLARAKPAGRARRQKRRAKPS